jgi:DNA-binding GntR family transcriptional regulator
VEEVKNEIRTAIEFGLWKDGLPIPQPVSIVEYFEVAA